MIGANKTEWTASDDRKTITGPCGCEYPNEAKSLMEIWYHRCSKKVKS